MLNDLLFYYSIIQEIKIMISVLIGNQLLSMIIVMSFLLYVPLEFLVANHNNSIREMAHSYLTNIQLFLFNNLVLSLLSISSLILIAESYQISAFKSFTNNPLYYLLAFIFFDITLYLWHRANHHYECLWKFHKVHHSDKSMNASTAFRVHFIEVLLTTLIKALFILITGIEAVSVLLCETISTVFVMFHHLSYSLKSEKWLKWIIIVPSLHRVHHSKLRNEHDNNYGAVFSLWDRLFKTLHEPKSVEIGLTGVNALNFFESLKFGLFPATPDPKAIVANQTFAQNNINAMIQEAAYYHAEKRGFSPGLETLDWFEAEKQIQQFNITT